MAKLELEQKPKRDFKSKIIRFLTSEDPDPLLSEEELVLDRWEFADLQMRLRKDYGSVIKLLMDKYHISQFTANNDYFTAQEVFATSRKLNKKYLLHYHIEDIRADLVKFRNTLYKYFDEGEKKEKKRIPSDKEIIALSKLNDSLVYALNSLPETAVAKDIPRPIFIFSLPDGQTMPGRIPLTDAIKMADELIDYEITNEDEHGE